MALADTLPDAPTGWRGDPAPFRIGSEQHKRMFCQMMLETHNPYKPAVIDWPVLTEEMRERLISLPIWDIAVQTEGKASMRVKAYADVVASDPWLKKAVDMNAFEEGRHKHVLSNLVAAYGIQLEPEPQYVQPKDTEWAFMVTGFSECIDSFFAFGLFEFAKRSKFFPEELIETFEPVMAEECRHILFFVNWVAWVRRNMPIWRRPWFELKVMAVWIFLGLERIGMGQSVADGAKPQDNNFTVTGASAITTDDIDITELMDVCLAENDRRMAGYDERLIRPMFMPRMVRLARRFMRSPQPKAA